MTATTCIACRAEGPPDDVPHEPWCPLFMRPVEFPQLDLLYDDGGPPSDAWELSGV